MKQTKQTTMAQSFSRRTAKLDAHRARMAKHDEHRAALAQYHTAAQAWHNAGCIGPRPIAPRPSR